MNQFQRLNDVNNREDARADDYLVFDMRLEWNKPKWLAFIEINNIFDQHYSTIESFSDNSLFGFPNTLKNNPLPEREVRVGFTLKLGV